MMTTRMRTRTMMVMTMKRTRHGKLILTMWLGQTRSTSRAWVHPLDKEEKRLGFSLNPDRIVVVRSISPFAIIIEEEEEEEEEEMVHKALVIYSLSASVLVVAWFFLFGMVPALDTLLPITAVGMLIWTKIEFDKVNRLKAQTAALRRAKGTSSSSSSSSSSSVHSILSSSVEHII